MIYNNVRKYFLPYLFSFPFFIIISKKQYKTITITVPEVIIVNEFFEPLFDTFYEAASTIQLNCVVKYITMSYSVVHWTHNGRLLNDDIVRGGIRYLFLIKIILYVCVPSYNNICYVPSRSKQKDKTNTYHNLIHISHKNKHTLRRVGIKFSN